MIHIKQQQQQNNHNLITFILIIILIFSQTLIIKTTTDVKRAWNTFGCRQGCLLMRWQHHSSHSYWEGSWYADPHALCGVPTRSFDTTLLGAAYLAALKGHELCGLPAAKYDQSFHGDLCGPADRDLHHQLVSRVLYHSLCHGVLAHCYQAVAFRGHDTLPTI